MADEDDEFSFFRGIHVRIDIRIDIISIKLMTTIFGKQFHLKDLTQMKLIKQMLVTSSFQDHVTNFNHLHNEWVPKATKLGNMVTYLMGSCP